MVQSTKFGRKRQSIDLTQYAIPQATTDEIVPTIGGVAIFKKIPQRTSIFGEKVTMVFPIHSGFNCSCVQCNLSRLVNDFSARGYRLTKFIAYDSSEKTETSLETIERSETIAKR
jgi:hypothetical protein